MSTSSKCFPAFCGLMEVSSISSLMVTMNFCHLKSLLYTIVSVICHSLISSYFILAIHLYIHYFTFSRTNLPFVGLRINSHQFFRLIMFLDCKLSQFVATKKSHSHTKSQAYNLFCIPLTLSKRAWIIFMSLSCASPH